MPQPVLDVRLRTHRLIIGHSAGLLVNFRRLRRIPRLSSPWRSVALRGPPARSVKKFLACHPGRSRMARHQAVKQRPPSAPGLARGNNDMPPIGSEISQPITFKHTDHRQPDASSCRSDTANSAPAESAATKGQPTPSGSTESPRKPNGQHAPALQSLRATTRPRPQRMRGLTALAPAIRFRAISGPQA